MKKYLYNIEDCCGCSVCYTSCAFNAITMKANKLGFLYPTIDSALCTECKICMSICPILNAPKKSEDIISEKAYNGYLINNKDLVKSSSGGFATAISKIIINQGGCVFGVEYGKSFIPEYSIAYTEEDLEKFRGSKYSETNRNAFHKNVEQELKNDRIVLVVGLPCDIAALKNYLYSKVDFSKLYLCELICNSVTSQRVLSEYIEELTQIFKKDVNEFRFRYKRDGKVAWDSIKCVFSDGSTHIEDLSQTNFRKAFFLLKRHSCYNCKFKAENSVADVVIGDFMGIEKEPYYNESGNSLIIPKTKKALKLINMLNKEYFKMIPVDYETAYSYNHMLYRSITRLDISDEFEKVFVSNKLNISCEIFEKKLKKDAVKLSKKIQHSACKVALWGAVSDLSVLYELFQMKDWNIKYIFDSSKYKIGIEHYGCVIKNIKDISFFRDDIDLVVTPISSVNHIMLVKQLKENGYDGELINIGKYRIITKI